MTHFIAVILMLSLPVIAGRMLVDATFRCLDFLKRRYGT